MRQGFPWIYTTHHPLVLPWELRMEWDDFVAVSSKDWMILKKLHQSKNQVPA